VKKIEKENKELNIPVEIEEEFDKLECYDSYLILPNNQTIRKLFQNEYESTFGE
tara:strand:+ start:489 stop:650 length:162 start_codon:yes stop_codon:yes gene_type:complete